MKKTVLGIVVAFILIQFIRPTKNDSSNDVNSIATVMEVPEDVKLILKTSCNDCHSNLTIYPWYNNVAPVSWFVAQHVNDGKEYLNFSEWTVYNKNQKKHILNNLEETLQSHQMPLFSYLKMHEEAIMTDEQYQTLLDWVKTIKVD